MTPYQMLQQWGRALAADRQMLTDTGSGGTVRVWPTGRSVLQINSTGNRVLESASLVPLGTEVLCLATASGVSVNSVSIADGSFCVFGVTSDASGANQWAALYSSLTGGGSGGEGGTGGAYSVVIPIANNFRSPAALITNLAGSDSAGILGLETGTHGTAGNTLNVTAATPSDDTFSARDPAICVPSNYVAGNDLTLTITVTETVAATTATVDASVTRVREPDTDIVTTAAQSCVAAAATEFTFAIDGADVVPGDVLDLLVSLTLDDGAATPEYDIVAIELSY